MSFKKTCQFFAKEFEKATIQPEIIQKRILQKIVSSNTRSEFGKKNKFHKMRNHADWQDVPLQTYESLKPYINKIILGNESVLTEEKVLCFEPTSGTQSHKYIPYTASVFAEFQKSISAWLYHTTVPGKQFWVTSMAPKEKIGGFNLGIRDMDYFTEEQKRELSNIIIQYEPTENPLNDVVNVLKQNPDISLASFWSPTFLLNILEHIDFQPKVVSCWADGTAQKYISELESKLSKTIIEPKGLLLTEGVISIPFKQAYPLAITSHYLEFLCQDDTLINSWELEKDNIYEPVLTTGAGLYRYKTNDLVVCTGTFNNTPTIRFVGRKGFLDFVGEKIPFGLLDNLINDKKNTFFGFEDESYVMYTSNPEINQEDVEKSLKNHYHYQLALKTQQLKPLRIYLTSENIEEKYRRINDFRETTFKSPTFIGNEKWSLKLKGKFKV